MNAPDLRFFDPLGPVRLGDLADEAGAACATVAAANEIAVAAVLERADATAVSFLEGRRAADAANVTA
ncbi:MAG: UDP-3-O-(3-hydroxymyristoyl)glucosamine N-acyltransferase, partial [Caulobacteraceae bacterium]